MIFLFFFLSFSLSQVFIIHEFSAGETKVRERTENPLFAFQRMPRRHWSESQVASEVWNSTKIFTKYTFLVTCALFDDMFLKQR